MINLRPIFNKLNKIEYVVLRNWQYFPYSYSGDIDILVKDQDRAVELLDVIKVNEEDFRCQYINKNDILFDIRCVDDGYYPAEFAQKILDSRRYDEFRNIYVPSKDLAFQSLLYHALFHKPTISNEYLHQFKTYLASEYGVSKPKDLSVQYKDNVYEGESGRREFGATSVVICHDNYVKKIYNNLDCYKTELEVLQKLDSCHFPKVLEYGNEAGKWFIIMTHMGELISPRNLPKNWVNQSQEIVNILKDNNIVHRDITPMNVFCNNKIISLIDFGWATSFECKDTLNQDNQNLGLMWKDPQGFNDEFSLVKVLSEIYFDQIYT